MKKIIILCAALFIALTAANGQDQEYRYHPWDEFKGDTTAFLNANFADQTQFFDGKSIVEVIDILEKEMPVKQIAYLTYPETSTLQVIELIFDERKQWKPFNQFHFYVGNFNKEYTRPETIAILNVKPEQITLLTQKIRKRISRFIFQKRSFESNFSAIKLISR
ncbi:MAG: hypothetical protein LIO68_04250 [Rikenellaceae bacterium]|nr:hypothetical protein [Rikenellaceae bacterium]